MPLLSLDPTALPAVPAHLAASLGDASPQLVAPLGDASAQLVAPLANVVAALPFGLDLLPALAGFAFGLSLIVAIGAQNAYVLRQGLRGEHILLVIAVCAASDVALILAGVAGAGAVLSAAPGLLEVVRLGGAAFLLGYAALAARRVFRPSKLDPTESEDPANLGVVLATVLALTWLNPHVYIDTVVLLGSVADSHGDDRWSFAAGACVASTLWFVTLGRGAALLRPLFARPAAWRVLDGFVAAVMTTLAITLVAGT